MSAFALGGLTQCFNRSRAASAVIVNSGGAAAGAKVLHRRMIIPHKRLITMEKSAVE